MNCVCSHCKESISAEDVFLSSAPEDGKTDIFVNPSDGTGNEKVGLFLFWWWWWWPWLFLANEDDKVKISFKQVSRREFESDSNTDLPRHELGKSFHSSEPVHLKTIRTPSDETYSCIIKQGTYMCDHFVDSDIFLSWLEYGKREEDPFCPQCLQDASEKDHLSVQARRRGRRRRRGYWRGYHRRGYYYPYYFWWGFWPWPFLFNGKSKVNVSFKQTSKKEFESNANEGVSWMTLGKSFGAQESIQVKTVVTSSGESYSCLMNKQEYMCSHFVDSDVMTSWLEDEKGPRDSFCPQCNQENH